MSFPEGLPSQVARGRTLVWGVLNVTPDSFSDGGVWLDASAAIAHGIAMASLGADIVDVGGESTRPGADRISVSDEIERVLPVVKALTEAGVVVSIDTMRADVAAAAVEAGAALINDVSGGLSDPAVRDCVASLNVPYVIMHWRGHSATMDELATYDDVVADVVTELAQRVAEAEAHGIRRERLIVDPGIGFAKQVRHNWPLLANLDALHALGLPVLIGASRKRFLGALLADATGMPRAVADRDAATHAVSAIAALAGVWGVRVHDVAGSADAVRVGTALRTEVAARD